MAPERHLPEALVGALVAAARAERRDLLLEPEGLSLVHSLGLEIPRSIVVAGPAELPSDLGLPGDRVVVKLLSPLVAHRTEVGGVRIVSRDLDAVIRAVAELAERSPDPAARYVVQEYVPHEMEPGGELLLGARWSAEFGPVVTLAPGGVTAEAMAALTVADGSSLVWSAERATVETVERDLEGVLGALLSGAYRGRTARVSVRELARVVGVFLEAARRWMPLPFLDVEVNPLIIREGRAVALDALIRLAPESTRPASPTPSCARPELGRFLHPRSVAVVGASARGMNPGRVILRNVLAAGMPPGSVRLVKPELEELDGCRCVPDLRALDPVDLLVLSVAAGEVPALMEEAVAGSRARAIILTSGGLGEGESDTAAARRIESLLRRPGAPVVNGGNCLGIRSVPGRCDTLFIPPEKLGFPDVPSHRVALVSQSGAFAIARASRLPWLNPRFVITVGNQLDVTVGEWLQHLVEEPELDVVGCYVEGFAPGDGRRFLEAVAAHRRLGRQVVLYRGGRTPEGHDATRSHTASLAGDYTVTRALAREAGTLVAETAQEFGDLLGIATRLHGRSVGGTGTGLVSNAGFECVAMADALGPLRRALLTDETRHRLRGVLSAARLDGLVSANNPLDLTPTLGDGAFVEAVGTLLGDPRVDVGVVGCVPLTPALRTLSHEIADPAGVAEGLAKLWRTTEKAWVVAVDGGPAYDPLAEVLTRAGLPVLREADRATALLGRYVRARLGGLDPRGPGP